MLGRQDVRENHCKLHFAERPARFDVGQNAPQSVHVLCHFTHFAQPPMHGCQLCFHRLKARGKPFAQRILQFFFHRRPYGVRRLTVRLTDNGQLFGNVRLEFGNGPRQLGTARRLFSLKKR